jgi:uncharacterized protein YdeI (YjbR/CyaY-like superfamily)
MNSNNLTNAAMRKKPGSLAYELAVSLYDEMSDLSDDNDKLELEASEASNDKIDVCSEAVYRIEQVEDCLQEILETVPDHQKAGNWKDMQDEIKAAMKLLNDAVIYFNAQQDI